MSTPVEQLAQKVEQLAKEIDTVKEAFRIYCDACDAGSTQLRRNLGTASQEFKRADERIPQRPQTPSEHHYDLNRIVWSESKGSKGPFLLATEREQSTDENKNNFNVLRAELKATGKGIYTKERQVWLMGDGMAIGCRNKEPKQ